MRITTFNCNGIRSAANKGLLDWLASDSTELLCLQETKAQVEDLAKDARFAPKGWWVYQNPAVKKGYAGTAVYARREPDAVLDKLGAAEFDDQGRYLELRFGKLSVISLYVPSGSAGPERQASKYRFMAFFLPRLREWAASGRQYVICADWNIAPTQLDLKNWRSNQKNSGFLPEERAWIATVLNEVGWADAYRTIHPHIGEGAYTWWSNRGNAYANNVGWRIDYQLVTPDLRETVKSAAVYKDHKFSDHAPLTIHYDV